MAAPLQRRIRVCHQNPWADRLESIEAFLKRIPTYNFTDKVQDPNDPRLMRMARLDCEWYAENARAILALSHAGLVFLPPLITGRTGLAELLSVPKEPDVEWWYIVVGQNPQSLDTLAGKAYQALAQRGFRILFYAFDEASRTMPCFREIAPHLSVFIHDENPIEPVGLKMLSRDCLRVHRSWVANIVPFVSPFNERPEGKIVFLGSELGLSAHRRRQIEFLRDRFKERFLAICDHSLPVSERYSLSKYKVSFCPEGRKFSTPAMGTTHTDRPFWSGCLGLVPVSENSKSGDRLESLHRHNLIVRYPHGDLEALEKACTAALALPDDLRRRIYRHYNEAETVGTVISESIFRFRMQ